MWHNCGCAVCCIKSKDEQHNWPCSYSWYEQGDVHYFFFVQRQTSVKRKSNFLKTQWKSNAEFAMSRKALTFHVLNAFFSTLLIFDSPVAAWPNTKPLEEIEKLFHWWKLKPRSILVIILPYFLIDYWQTYYYTPSTHMNIPYLY